MGIPSKYTTEPSSGIVGTYLKRLIKSGQKLVCKKRYIDVDLPEFDYAACAEGFGCYGEVVTDPNQLKAALNRAKNSNKPAVIDVKIAFDTPDGVKLLLSLGVL